MTATEPILLANRALREAAVLVPRTEFETIECSGKDRVEFLHRLVTSHVKKLCPGQGQESLLLDSRGKILTPFLLLAGEERLSLRIERTLVPRFLAGIERYRFSEDVSFLPKGDGETQLSLFGPRAAEILRQVFSGTQLPQKSWDHRDLSWQGRLLRLVRNEAWNGWDLLHEKEKSSALRDALLEGRDSKKIVETDGSWFEMARIEMGIPRYGTEIDESCYPQEARLESLCAPDKGCYIGQETVARMTTYGKPPRLLVGLGFSRDSSPRANDPLRHEGQTVGEWRSRIFSPRLGIQIGMGLVKNEQAHPGNRLEFPDGTYVWVLSLPFSQEEIARLVPGSPS